MTLDWPLVALVAVVLVASVAALRVSLPYVVGLSSEKARAKALDDINRRLSAVEGVVSQGRRMPGRLG